MSGNIYKDWEKWCEPIIRNWSDKIEESKSLGLSESLISRKAGNPTTIQGIKNSILSKNYIKYKNPI